MTTMMKKLWFLPFLAWMTACDSDGGTTTARDDERVRYVALDADGIPSRGIRVSCVKDARTDLVWEYKAENEGLHDWRSTYSWFNPNQAHHELDYRGTANAGNCSASECDTWSFVNAVNESKLCGYDDWRVPTRDELFSISDLGKSKSPPTINTDFFPNAQAAEYWSSNDYSFQPDSAWVWNFQYGHDRVDWKKAPKYVRLVRGEATELASVKE